LLILFALLIGAEGTRLLRDYELSETPQEGTTEEAHGRARGKRSAWSGNQQATLTELSKKMKTPFAKGVFALLMITTKEIFK
jgi:hypothetical protein